MSQAHTESIKCLFVTRIHYIGCIRSLRCRHEQNLFPLGNLIGEHVSRFVGQRTIGSGRSEPNAFLSYAGSDRQNNKCDKLALMLRIMPWRCLCERFIYIEKKIK